MEKAHFVIKVSPKDLPLKQNLFEEMERRQRRYLEGQEVCDCSEEIRPRAAVGKGDSRIRHQKI
jgi:hypothetical protein